MINATFPKIKEKKNNYGVMEDHVTRNAVGKSNVLN